VKVAVVYTSMTGNTKKLAEVIAGVFGVTAQTCNEVKENASSIAEFDLLAVGSGVYGGRMGRDLEQLINGLPHGQSEGRKAIVFGTVGGQTTAIKAMEKLLTQKGIEVIGSFYCKGQAWFLLNHGRPNERDLVAVRQFAENIKLEVGIVKNEIQSKYSD
jgi:flavodoxin